MSKAFLAIWLLSTVLMMFCPATNILPQTERELGKSDLASKSG